jgi:hypothetical protein
MLKIIGFSNQNRQIKIIRAFEQPALDRQLKSWLDYCRDDPGSALYTCGIRLKRTTEFFYDHGFGGCPACGQVHIGEPQDIFIKEGLTEVRRCTRCHALYGEVSSLLESYELVKPEWAGDYVSDNQRYFDFVYPDLRTEETFARRHGYFDITSHKITQTG